MKTKIEIKSIFGKLLFEFECENNTVKKTVEKAIESSADLSSADLSFADLSFANLRFANLRSADLRSANLRSADLSFANLRYANLRSADLRYADLSFANLSSANLSYADQNEGTLFLSIACPEEGSFIAYKKADDKIVKLMITEDAKRSSATTLKCRASKAKIISIENVDGTPCDQNFVSSDYDASFIYRIGEVVEVTNFDEDRWNECAPGVHFFLSKELAKQYN